MTPRTYLFVPGNRPERFAKALACGRRRRRARPGRRGGAGTTRTRRAARSAQFLAAASAEQRARLVRAHQRRATPWFDADLGVLARSAGARADAAQGRAAGDGGARACRLPGRAGAGADRKRTRRAQRRGAGGLRRHRRGWSSAPSTSRSTSTCRPTRPSATSAWTMPPAGWRWPRAPRACRRRWPASRPTSTTRHRLLADFARARPTASAPSCASTRSRWRRSTPRCSPARRELDWARRVVAAAEGSPGAVQVDGRMVDKPVLQRAQRLLARAAPR